jgi:hypothetical protein
MRLLRPFLILAIVQTVLIGCIASREATPVPKWPPSPAEVKKSLTLSVSAGLFYNWNERPYMPPNSYCYRLPQMHSVTCTENAASSSGYSSIVKAFEEAGLFSKVLTKEGEADLQVSVKLVTRVMEHMGGAMLAACTLFIVPGHLQSREFVIRATFTDRDGKVLAKFRKVETSAQWGHLFFLFVPFVWAPQGDETGAAYDMTRAIIIEANEKKII